MRILFLHNKYLISGGEDVSTQSEIDLLINKGHEIDFLYLTNKDLKQFGNIQLALNTIYSRKSFRKIDKILKSKQYDLVHVQNFMPLLSPSILYAAKRNNVKTVMSIRNYRLICPNALMYVNGGICEECVGKSFPYPALAKKCYKDSYSATGVVAGMLTFHNIMNTWNSKVDGYIAISEFVKNQLIKGGISKDKIYVKYNFVDNAPNFNLYSGKEFLYVGRLSKEKGIEFLLSAFDDYRLKDVKLNIIGEGPEVQKVLDAAIINTNIVYRGKQNLKDTYQAMSQSRALIFPSQWHEPFGRTIVEAFAVGTPVIGSSVGGVTELIVNNINGMLFDSQSLDELVNHILYIQECKNYQEYRLQARRTFDKSFNSNLNYLKVMEIYNKVISS